MTKMITLGAALIAGMTAGCVARAEPDFSAERIKAHVTFLANDFLEGREAGTRGHEIAAGYVATQFALLGVKPGGQDGTYFQNVDLREVAPAGSKPTLALTTPGGTQILEQGGAVLIRGPVAGGIVKLNAPLVFVGYGMKDATVGYDDYKGLDVEGKIAVALWGSPKGMDSEVGAHLQNEQGRVAAEHGAAAIVFVQTRATAGAFPWKMILERGRDPLTTWVRRDGTPFDRNYGLQASVLIEPEAAVALFNGAPRTLEQILNEADQAGGRPTGFALKSTAAITVGTELRRFSSPGVIGVIEGSDDNLKDEYVALIAHADHIGIEMGKPDPIRNGALDNGAGVATLLEVARAFVSTAEPPRRSILLLASTAEEKGLLGTEYFAQYPTVPIERVTAAIGLDMPMLLYNFTDVVAYGAGHTTLEGMIRNAAAAMEVKLSADPMPEQAIFVRSDHYAMVKAGVPAVMLATGMANGGEAAWTNFFANNYHQPSDDLSLPIVWSAGAKFAELNYRVVRALADADGRAQWFARDYFGDLFAAKAPKAAKSVGQ